MDHAAALKGNRAIGKGKCEVKIMVDDNDRHLTAKLVETLEQQLDDRWSQPLERLIQEKHPHVSRQGAGNRHHLLLAT